MPPGRAPRRGARRHASRRGRGRLQAIELGQDRGGLRLVSRSQLGEVRVRDVAGGVLELVEDGVNGLVTEPNPQAVAAAMDQLYMDRARTARMGDANAQRLVDLKIDWGTVVEAMTS